MKSLLEIRKVKIIMEKFMKKDGSTEISQEELDKCKYRVKRIKYYYSQRVVGQENLALSLLVSVIANGHILLESVPGLAKTTAAKALTEAVSGKFSRIQCTPDLLPSDIIGTQTFNYSTNAFDTKLGPVYANFVLLDEINRSSAKTQSAMLEAMQERQVTIGGEVYKMPKIFIVIATQNPTGWIGTQSLPNSQLDRFMIRLNMGYPDMNNLIEIMKDRHHENPLDKVKHVINKNELINLQELAGNIYVSDEIYEYISKLVEKTREHELIKLGISPRGALAICKMAKAKAMLGGRDYVVPQDVQYIFKDVCSHRIIVESRSMINEVNTDEIMKEIIESVENE